MPTKRMAARTWLSVLVLMLFAGFLVTSYVTQNQRSNEPIVIAPAPAADAIRAHPLPPLPRSYPTRELAESSPPCDTLRPGEESITLPDGNGGFTCEVQAGNTH